GGRGGSDSDYSARDRITRPALPWKNVLAVHAAVRGVALRHRDLQGRSARHDRRLLDVPVHLDRAGTARGVHAHLSRPSIEGTGTTAGPEGCIGFARLKA